MGRTRKVVREAQVLAPSLVPPRTHAVRLGPGSERAEARTYVVGDDTRHIDWSATARTGQVLVRDTLMEHERNIVCLVENTPSLDFGTSSWTKREVGGVVTLATVAAFAQTGAFAYAVDGDAKKSPPVSGSNIPSVLAPAVLSRGLAPLSSQLQTAATFPSETLVVVVSDFFAEGFERALRMLAATHSVVAVRVTDDRERTLTPVGWAQFNSQGKSVMLPTDSEHFRARFAAAADELYTKRTARIARCGVLAVEVATSASRFQLQTAAQKVLDLGEQL